MKRKVSLGIVAMVTWLIASCSDDEKPTTEVGSTMQFQIGAGLSASNSIQICGTRVMPADEAFNCASALPTEMGQTDSCTCYNLNAEGNVDSDGNFTNVDYVRGLCPSTVAPESPWSFDYTLYTAPDCAGMEVPDLTCYDSRDLLSRMNPGGAIEDLDPGLNENHVVCISTQAAEKLFEFTSCTITSFGVESLRFDCDCTETAGACGCGPDGPTMADLAGSGCAFEAMTCDIVCAGVPTEVP